MSSIPLIDPIRVSPDALRAFATDLLLACGLPDADAALIAGYLVDVDLRGIDSHGTRQLRRYVPEYRDGAINPTPRVRVLRETDAVLRYDGDGGAGYVTATQCVNALVQKASAHGIAVGASGNHGHIGSAGIYARIAAGAGLISWIVAGGSRWGLRPDDRTVWDAMKAPPMCFGVPSDAEPPLILDTNANLFGPAEQAEAALEAGFGHPVFASLGMRFVSTLVGGLLAGARYDGEPERTWLAATRGALIVLIAPDAVGDAIAFRAEVARVMTESLRLEPMKGLDAAELPGTIEHRRTQERMANGIPVGKDHRALLAGLAEPLGISMPW